MFKPEEMVKIEVLTLNRYKDSLLTYLHKQGVLEIREIDVSLAQKDAPNEFYRKATSYSIGILVEERFHYAAPYLSELCLEAVSPSSPYTPY